MLKFDYLSNLYKFIRVDANMNKGPIRIFYADDDLDDHYLFETALLNSVVPYKLTAFTSGLSLEKELIENNYNCDLVFLDINMPGKDGLAVLETLQPTLKKNLVRVIVFSTSNDPRIIKKTFELKASLFVQKPNSFKELQITVQTILERMTSSTADFENFNFKCDNVN